MKVVAIGGSPRLKGNSNYLIDQALNELAKRGIETEKYVLSQYKINPCLAHDNCRELKKCMIQDDVPWILEKFSQADGVIIASPVYFASISAQIKIFLDRSFFLFTHDIKMKARCWGLIAVTGRMGADEAMLELKKFTGPPGADVPNVFTMKASAGGPDKHVKDNPEIVEEARKLGRQMADVLTGKK